jgi:hypothetical protein
MTYVEVDKRLVVLLTADIIENLKEVARGNNPGTGCVQEVKVGDNTYKVVCVKDILGQCSVQGYPELNRGRIVPGS